MCVCSQSVSRQSVCDTGIICSVIDDRRKEQSVGVSSRPTTREPSKAGTARHGTYSEFYIECSVQCSKAQLGAMS